ncbi:MAG TPA: bifunctional diaminohydroxyphosphoribosylaminopyrimidine deaminase/5-amino-6-(5-phosphoribosylamino)uracil reductase RibD [Acidimicrobiia bacterium]|nr:bifunctional diaminohydroxyphosphoribosylaminopyrimidine deaminase/5-amino-6-(5-phosphoribosylamino)uracil reductase RibD [Acidimicrobiia bacterium]
MRHHMLEAIRLAAAEHPHPNPRVGAIVLDPGGSVVGRGAHVAAGAEHAESIALAEAGERARDGTMVVTLEPCSHLGRTPPCTEAILRAGISRVIVGVGDPDERVSGSGIARLREAGVEVVTDVAPAEVHRLDPGYFHHRRTGRPLVTLKMAATLDGQSAAADGSSRWITGPEAREDAHRLRAASDAVMVGAGTVRDDDPRLTVRLDGYGGHQPRPVIVAGRGPLPRSAAIFSREPLVYSPHPVDTRGEVVVMPSGDVVDLVEMIADLGKRDIVDLLCEGGPHLATGLLQEGLVDRLVLYLGGSLAMGTGRPVLGGVFASVDQARRVDITRITRFGPDLRVDAEVA